MTGKGLYTNSIIYSDLGFYSPVVRAVTSIINGYPRRSVRLWPLPNRRHWGPVTMMTLSWLARPPHREVWTYGAD